MTLRVAIYARYSSDTQREASIEDQVRLCKERLAAEGWELVQVYRDAALSGASTLLRPGYQALLTVARDGAFDVVVAEALDRLSRDQEDVAGLFKRLRFAGIRLVTLAEGEISELHVGLKGTMNALFLKDLAAKTHRGLRGRIEAGRSAGGRCYGYAVVRHVNERGEPVRGERAVNPAEAAVVRRIFTLFAAGASPIAIARRLNAEGLPGPDGRTWRDTTIRGHAARGTGLLRNALYAGQLVWNRMHFLKDPATGRRVSRPNPQTQWITEPVPELRIIDPELWGRAQLRLADLREAHGANNPDRDRFWERRHARHMLSGKLFCGRCGGAVSAIGRDYLACSAARKQGTCGNTRSLRRGTLDRLILEALKSRLMQPAQVAAFIAAFTAEWNRLQAEASAQEGAQCRELETITRKLAGLIDAIADGFRAPGLQQKLDELETRKAALERAMQSPPAPALRLHQNLAELYRRKVETLQAALAGPDHGEALEAVRALIERVELSPAAGWHGVEIALVGELAAMLRLALGSTDRRLGASDPALFACSVKVVAGTGFEPVTFRL